MFIFEHNLWSRNYRYMMIDFARSSFIEKLYFKEETSSYKFLIIIPTSYKLISLIIENR